MNKRKELLKKIAEKEKINKIAEEIANDINLANEEDPDLYAHNVFMKMVHDIVGSMKIEGLEEGKE